MKSSNWKILEEHRSYIDTLLRYLFQKSSKQTYYSKAKIRNLDKFASYS